MDSRNHLSPDPTVHADSAPGPEGFGPGHRDVDGRPAAPGRPRSTTLSRILLDIARDDSQDNISINSLVVRLGGRGRAGLILLFALPNVLPSPPGLSGLLGVPLLYLSVQMMLGRVPWLPRFVGERAMTRARFGALVERVEPWLSRAERLLRPRWSLMVGHAAERLIGAFCLLLAAVLALPIPLGNMLPALAICLIALGVLERDGLWVVIGVATGLLALSIVVGVVYALLKSAIFLLLNAFG